MLLNYFATYLKWADHSTYDQYGLYQGACCYKTAKLIQPTLVQCIEVIAAICL